MIFLGINKPNFKTIRNPSANLWSSLLGTLGQQCWAGGGVGEGPPSPARCGLGLGVRRRGARSPGSYLPRPALSHRGSLSPAGALRPPRRPAQALPQAVLSADQPRTSRESPL